MAEYETLETQEISLRCAGEHQWTEVWPVPCLADHFLKRMKAASRCPRCNKPSFLRGDIAPSNAT